MILLIHAIASWCQSSLGISVNFLVLWRSPEVGFQLLAPFVGLV